MGKRKIRYIKELIEEKVKVDKRVWRLVNHHIRNDLNLVSVSVGSLELMPRWLLAAGSWVMKVLYKISFNPGPPPESLYKTCEVSLKGVRNIDSFLRKLERITYPEDSSD